MPLWPSAWPTTAPGSGRNICRASFTGFIAPIPRARSTRSKAPAWAWPSSSRSWICTAAPSPFKVNWAGERSLPFGFPRITLNSRFELWRVGPGYGSGSPCQRQKITSLSSSGQLLVLEVLSEIKLDSEHSFIETTCAETHRLMKRALAVCVWLGVPLLLAGCKHFQSVPLAAEPAAAAFDARSLDDPGLANFLAHNQLPPEVPWHPPTKWNLPALTLVAFYFHPNLEVARAQWSVAKAGIRTAGGRLNQIGRASC